MLKNSISRLATPIPWVNRLALARAFSENVSRSNLQSFPKSVTVKPRSQSEADAVKAEVDRLAKEKADKIFGKIFKSKAQKKDEIGVKMFRKLEDVKIATPKLLDIKDSKIIKATGLSNYVSARQDASRLIAYVLESIIDRSIVL